MEGKNVYFRAGEGDLFTRMERKEGVRRTEMRDNKCHGHVIGVDQRWENERLRARSKILFEMI